MGAPAHVAAETGVVCGATFHFGGLCWCEDARTYRGCDIFWWMEAAGVLDERYDDLIRARHLPSPQLIGTPERRSLDLNAIAALGVEVVGRLGTIREGVPSAPAASPTPVDSPI